MSIWGYSTVNAGSAAVGTASAEIIAANPGRLYLRLQNMGTVAVSLGFGAAAVADEAVRLAAGDSFEMKRSNVYSGSVSGIAAEDDVPVGYLEGE